MGERGRKISRRAAVRATGGDPNSRPGYKPSPESVATNEQAGVPRVENDSNGTVSVKRGDVTVQYPAHPRGFGTLPVPYGD